MKSTNQNNETYEFLTLKETAQFLGIKIAYLYKLTHLKQIPYYKPGGKLIRFLKSDLVEYLLKNKVNSVDSIGGINA